MIGSRWGSLLAALGLAGCTVSPVPEPPGPQPKLGTSVSIGGGCEGCAVSPLLSGGPGSTSDATHVWGVNLDRQDPPVTAPTNADGSFTLSVPGEPGQQVRLQARRDRQRSLPRDFVLFASGAPMLQDRVPTACWSAPLEIDLGSAPSGAVRARTLVLRALCLEPLQVDAVALRAPSAAFSVRAPALPQVIMRGEFLEVVVEFAPPGAQPYEEVLLIQIGGDAPDRRGITLFGWGGN
ncbi:MAG TPA: hypothetical protein VI072_31785 [Polyangiaceae bacterium]